MEDRDTNIDVLATGFKSFDDLIDKFPEKVKNACESGNDRFAYLSDYLSTLGCRTAIIEKSYIDKNYLEDFAHYYSRCFEDYPKKCARVHFFSSEFDNDQLKQDLVSAEINRPDTNYSDSYLGFIVFRPLPNAPLAKVCLKIYDSKGKNRIFPVLRLYTVHLLGMELRVHSLAFQEQDKALSACATSALWSAFHGSHSLSVNGISAPSTITENAKKIIPQYTYNHPNRGLTPAQMASSVREEGLAPLLCNFINTSYLKALMRAYLSVGIAPVLGVSLYYADEQAGEVDGISRSTTLGEHAVAVAGYNFPRSSNAPLVEFKIDELSKVKTPAMERPMYLLSSMIDKLYVHDDEIGPFAKMEFINEYWQHLTTQWHTYRSDSTNINATVRDILFPKPPKIRISFNTIFSIIREFNSLYTGQWYDIGGRVVWDIYLTTVNDFKSEILNRDIKDFIDDSQKYRLLTMHLPRYIWRVDGYMLDPNEVTASRMSFTFIFDATEIENSDIFKCAVHYDLKSRIELTLATFTPLLSAISNKTSKFSHAYRIADEYTEPKTEKIL